jgi:hypothetical protein
MSVPRVFRQDTYIDTDPCLQTSKTAKKLQASSPLGNLTPAKAKKQKAGTNSNDENATEGPVKDIEWGYDDTFLRVTVLDAMSKHSRRHYRGK